MNSKMTLRSIFTPHSARKVLQFICSYPMLVICLAVGLVWDRMAPSSDALPEVVQGFYAATFRVGVVCMLLDMCWQSVRCVIVPDGSQVSRFVDATLRVFERWALLSLGLIAIRAHGHELANLVVYSKSNPDHALSFIAACVVLRIVYTMVPQRQVEIAAVRSGDIPSSVDIPRNARTPQEIHRTALHEAGHLVLFGVRGELPEGLKVEVYSAVGNQDKYRGLVRQTKPILSDSVRTEADLRWLMLMQLAGLEAEHVVLGDRANGGSSDHSSWLLTATEYLTSGFGEVFYAEPDREAQREHNRAVLNDLKTTMTAEVRQILGRNKALLEELTQAIVDAKSMDREALAPYLSRVSIDAK